MKENGIGTINVDCALELHRNLGPSLLETVYEVTLARAIERRGQMAQRRLGLSISIKERLLAKLSRRSHCWRVLYCGIEVNRKGHSRLQEALPDPPLSQWS